MELGNGWNINEERRLRLNAIVAENDRKDHEIIGRIDLTNKSAEVD